EMELEQKRRAELGAAKAKLEQTLSTTRQKSESLKQQILQKHQDHLAQIAARFESDLKQLNANDQAVRQRIAGEFEKADHELKHKLQQSTWLADSVLEATQNQLRDESSKGKRDHAAQNELLDGLENKAGALMFS